MHLFVSILSLLFVCSSLVSAAPQAKTAAKAAAKAKSPTKAKKPTRGTLVITMSGFKPAKGFALVSLYRSAKGFPGKNKYAYRRFLQKVTGNKVTVRVKNLPFGVYAAAAIHDANSNKKLDTGAFGIPKEAYGASNNARRLMGPPPYHKAKFKFRKHLQIINFQVK